MSKASRQFDKKARQSAKTYRKALQQRFTEAVQSFIAEEQRLPTNATQLDRFYHMYFPGAFIAGRWRKVYSLPGVIESAAEYVTADLKYGSYTWQMLMPSPMRWIHNDDMEAIIDAINHRLAPQVEKRRRRKRALSSSA